MTGPGKPRLGQHFLRSEAVLGAILAAAEVRPGERVLEIGPGPGVLTRPLLTAVGPTGAVVAVELDAALARALRTDAPENLRVVHGDAVQADLAAHGPFDRIVANLPYQISGPIVARFVKEQQALGWQRAVLLVQKEFGARVLAGPGSKAYGRLSVHAARVARGSKVRDVPPGCFDPPPDVDSMVVRLDVHPSPPFDVKDDALWDAVVDGAFQQRRKKLRNTVPPVLARKGIDAQAARQALDAQGLADLRPEAVAPDGFARLVEALA